MPESKVCRGCGLDRPLTDYHRSKAFSSGLKSRCKACCVAYGKAYRRDNPERLKNTTLMHMYGITLIRYYEILAHQGGMCAICFFEPEEDQFLYVDHNHTTGEIRGLLCLNCNSGLGMFRDNQVSLLTAVHYLEGHNVRA